MSKIKHIAHRQYDEFYCARCGARWGLKDPPPEKCVKVKPPKLLQTRYVTGFLMEAEMANLVPSPSWDDVYQIEQSDRVLGGPGGVTNIPTQALLNRTELLRNYAALPFIEGREYQLKELVRLDNGDIVRNIAPGNTNDPNNDMTGWVPDIYSKIDNGSIETGINSPALGTNPNLTPSRYGHSIRRPEMSTQDIGVFVDPVNGNDSNDGATQSTALRSFAAAMNKIPYRLFHKARIYCMDGTYDEAPIVQFIWMSSSRWANFQVVGHTPSNPAYTDTKPENVVFSKTLSTGERQAVLWGAMPGSNFNTILSGVTLDNFWPYDVTCQVQDCIIRRGGGAFNNYGVGGHGGRIGFKRVKFKDFPADGLLCEATDFSHFHFDDCTLDNVLCPIAGVRNQSIVSFERCGWDLSTSTCEPSSFIIGENSVYMNQFGIGVNNKTDGFAAFSGNDIGSGSATYNSGGQVVVFGKDYPTTDAGCVASYFGSRETTLTSAKFSVRYSTPSGTYEAFRVKWQGFVLPKLGYQMNAVNIADTNGFTNSFFVDAADNKLKFRDSNNVVKLVTLA